MPKWLATLGVGVAIGAAALRAAVAPASSSYLYFVSRNDGTHEFSSSYTEHAAAVDRFQKGRRSRPQ